MNSEGKALASLDANRRRGNTIKLRETPYSLALPSQRLKSQLVARVMTSGTVKTRGDWAIRSQALNDASSGVARVQFND